MPNYSAAKAVTLNVGQSLVVADSTLTSPFTSQAIAVGREPGANAVVAIFNTTPLTATIQGSWQDVDGSYVTTGVTVVSNACYYIVSLGPFLRISLPSAPASGQVVFAR